MNPTAAQLRQLKRDNLKYPDHLVEIPASEWPPNLPMVSGSGTFIVRVYRSRKFQVLVWDQDGTIRLSVNRTEWDHSQKRYREDISWDDLQRLKREAGYGLACAVELFPPDANVINVANMRHLFLVPQPPFMWR